MSHFATPQTQLLFSYNDWMTKSVTIVAVDVQVMLVLCLLLPGCIGCYRQIFKFLKVPRLSEKIEENMDCDDAGSQAASWAQLFPCDEIKTLRHHTSLLQQLLQHHCS